ncbi:prepilin peptidase [Isoptericola sp. NPDC058082]|uniref:prepilin peptidase n=1 Tax=Isoptericola sp. NPDC058082 TaxID=3346331 RepID=UPI0036EACB7F
MPPILQRARAEVAPHRRAATWGAALAAAWAVWASGPGWSTPALVVAAVAGAALWVIDARTHRLPDALTYPTTAVVGALLALAALGGGTWDKALRALLGGLLLGGAYLLLHLAHRSGMGRGDAKLAALLGLVTAWYGWSTLVAAAVLPILLGGAVAIVLMATRRASRGTSLAFGPYLLAGAAIAVTLARLASA